MTSNGILQILVFFGVTVLVTKPLGLFMSRLFQGERTFLHPVFRPLEVLVYRLCGVRENDEQRWTQYTASLLSFSLIGFLFTYALMRLQGLLPLNPQGFGASQVKPDQAFNTSMSFMTNTDWQWYSGESTMSYLVQMAALAVQNFVSAAAGIAVAIAVIRGFAREETDRLGNFWVDLTRTVVYILLPLCIVTGLFFCSQGVIQNFHPVHGRQDGRRRDADDRAGSGRLAGGHQADRDQRRRLLQRQLGASVREPDAVHELLRRSVHVRHRGRPHLHVRPHGQGHATRLGALLGHVGHVPDGRLRRRIRPNRPAIRSWRSWAWKPRRRRRSRAATWRARRRASASRRRRSLRPGTTDATCGAVNSMHDSFTPLGGLVTLFNIQTDEVIFGGVGSGLFAMLLYAIVGIFITGLMVGRTPEYLGKKIQQKEVKMALFAILVTSFLILVVRGDQRRRAVCEGRLLESAGAGDRQLQQRRSARSERSALRVLERRRKQRQRVRRHHRQHALVRPHARPRDPVRTIPVHHSRARRRGQPGAAKKRVPDSAGTLPTHGPLFVAVLVTAVIVVGALTFFPALSLGPIVEHFLMHEGRLFSTVLYPFSVWS